MTPIRSRMARVPRLRRAREPEYATDARKAPGGGGPRCIQSAIVIDFSIFCGSGPHRCFSARPRGAVEPHYVDTAKSRPANISGFTIHDCSKSEPRRLHTTSPMAARRPNYLFAASSRVFLPSPGSCARVIRPTANLPPHLRRNLHIKATPSTSSIEGPVDLSEQTQAIPKLSGAGPFPAGKWHCTASPRVCFAPTLIRVQMCASRFWERRIPCSR